MQCHAWLCKLGPRSCQACKAKGGRCKLGPSVGQGCTAKGWLRNLGPSIRQASNATLGCAHLAHAIAKYAQPGKKNSTVCLAVHTWPKRGPNMHSQGLAQKSRPKHPPSKQCHAWLCTLGPRYCQVCTARQKNSTICLAVHTWPKRGPNMHSQGLAQQSLPKHSPSKQCHAWLCTLGPRYCQVCTARQKKLNYLSGCAYLAQAWFKYAHQGLAQKSRPKHPPSKQCHDWLCTLGLNESCSLGFKVGIFNESYIVTNLIKKTTN